MNMSYEVSQLIRQLYLASVTCTSQFRKCHKHRTINSMNANT
jgi:hypothetical protein